jgi:hypothetical protein
MPISDYLLSLALALHPSADGKAVTLGADTLIQPTGGVAAAGVDAGSKDAAKSKSRLYPVKMPTKLKTHPPQVKSDKLVKVDKPTADYKKSSVKTEPLKGQR